MTIALTSWFATVMRKAQDEEIAENGVEGVEDVIFFQQRIQNACGSFALLHALANTDVPITPGVLTELFASCHDKVREDDQVAIERKS